jgi:hypothetical protein
VEPDAAPAEVLLAVVEVVDAVPLVPEAELDSPAVLHVCMGSGPLLCGSSAPLQPARVPSAAPTMPARRTRGSQTSEAGRDA